MFKTFIRKFKLGWPLVPALQPIPVKVREDRRG